MTPSQHAGKIALQAIYDGPGALIVPTYAGLRQRGEVRILRLQIGGESASGLRHEDGDWRCLALEKFSSVRPERELQRKSQ